MLPSIWQPLLLHSLYFYSCTHGAPTTSQLEGMLRDQKDINRPIEYNSFLPRSHTSKVLLPRTITPPLDPVSLRFQELLTRLSSTPLQYENPRLINKALSAMPLSELESEARAQCQLLQTQAASTSNGEPVWGYSECLLRAMLRYAHSVGFKPSLGTHNFSLTIKDGSSRTL